MRTVLIVDDEFGVADVLVAALEDEGYRVFTAANGRQGLERLAENKPDLVVLDFMMPLLDGPGMARAMRAERAYEAIPIIMMSAVGEAAVRERFDGYAAFLRKPFSIPVFLKTVAGVIAGRS
ncbi:MAG TPA: response regulator [Pseudolabrys sp.]|nr:response regulator [Pseudolabrys sp.]